MTYKKIYQSGLIVVKIDSLKNYIKLFKLDLMSKYKISLQGWLIIGEKWVVIPIRLLSKYIFSYLKTKYLYLAFRFFLCFVLFVLGVFGGYFLLVMFVRFPRTFWVLFCFILYHLYDIKVLTILSAYIVRRKYIFLEGGGLNVFLFKWTLAWI